MDTVISEEKTDRVVDEDLEVIDEEKELRYVWEEDLPEKFSRELIKKLTKERVKELAEGGYWVMAKLLLECGCRVDCFNEDFTEKDWVDIQETLIEITADMYAGYNWHKEDFFCVWDVLDENLILPVRWLRKLKRSFIKAKNIALRKVLKLFGKTEPMYYKIG
jgi:hypothetical protein